MKGWIVAAVVAAFSLAAGIGAAVVPAAEAQAVAVRAQAPRVMEMMSGGSRIGISIRDVDESGQAGATGAAGVVVEDVAAGGAAEKAGMRKGDVLVEFDGERVRSARQLTRLVQETPSGRTVQATLIRDGQRTTVSVTPAAAGRARFEFGDLEDWARDMRFQIAPRPPDAPVPPRAPVPPLAWEFEGSAGGSRLGITVERLTPQLAEYFGVKSGVLVMSVRDGSAASKAGLKAGDVITAVNGSAVEQPADVRRRLRDLDGGDEFTIAATRDRKTVTLKGTIERVQPQRQTSSSVVL